MITPSQAFTSSSTPASAGNSASWSRTPAMARVIRDPVARAHAGRNHRHAHCIRNARAVAKSRKSSSFWQPPENIWRKRRPRRCAERIRRHRPLVGTAAGTHQARRRPTGESSSSVARTASLSRDHVIQIDRSGLVTSAAANGRLPPHAEDCVDQAATLAQSRKDSASRSICTSTAFTARTKKPHRSSPRWQSTVPMPANPQADRGRPRPQPTIARRSALRKAEVIWAVRNEMRARGRHSREAHRALFLNARAALAMAPAVADLMAKELGWTILPNETVGRISGGRLELYPAA